MPKVPVCSRSLALAYSNEYTRISIQGTGMQPLVSGRTCVIQLRTKNELSNEYSRMSNEYPRYQPVCSRSWLRSVFLALKPFPHHWQISGFSPLHHFYIIVALCRSHCTFCGFLANEKSLFSKIYYVACWCT